MTCLLRSAPNLISIFVGSWVGRCQHPCNSPVPLCRLQNNVTQSSCVSFQVFSMKCNAACFHYYYCQRRDLAQEGPEETRESQQQHQCPELNVLTHVATLCTQMHVEMCFSSNLIDELISYVPWVTCSSSATSISLQPHTCFYEKTIHADTSTGRWLQINDSTIARLPLDRSPRIPHAGAGGEWICGVLSTWLNLTHTQIH